MKYENLNLSINNSLNQFELDIEDSIAFVEYKLANTILFLIHTEVPPALEGKGVGSAIVLKTLEYALENRYTVVPLCSFVQTYLKRHPEWNHLVHPNVERFTDNI